MNKLNNLLGFSASSCPPQPLREHSASGSVGHTNDGTLAREEGTEKTIRDRKGCWRLNSTAPDSGTGWGMCGGRRNFKQVTSFGKMSQGGARATAETCHDINSNSTTLQATLELKTARSSTSF
eukprot:m.338912 g.338912  ORF g.338912 m.338912 type:complete len:123 (-) comp16539_c0_seq7:1750-2118(-)